MGACADGTCQVWARAGDRIRFDARGRAAVDLAEFNVVGVDRQLRYTAAGSGGGTNFSGASTAPGTIIVNGLRIKLVRIDDGRALLRMT
ncbi:hypothetical protein NKH77_16160 [Streptomyces sp. M19]